MFASMSYPPFATCAALVSVHAHAALGRMPWTKRWAAGRRCWRRNLLVDVLFELGRHHLRLKAVPAREKLSDGGLHRDSALTSAACFLFSPSACLPFLAASQQAQLQSEAPPEEGARRASRFRQDGGTCPASGRCRARAARPTARPGSARSESSFPSSTSLVRAPSPPPAPLHAVPGHSVRRRCSVNCVLPSAREGAARAR